MNHFFLLVESLQTLLLHDEGEHASTSFCPLLHHFNVLRNAETNCNVFATCAKQCQWGGYRAQWNGKIGLVVTDLLPSILNPRAVSPYHVERDNEETTGTIFCENTSSKSSKSGDSFLMISDSFYTLSYHIISDIIFLSARPDIPGSDHSFTVHMPPVFGGICLRNFFCSIGSLHCQLRRNPFQKDGD